METVATFHHPLGTTIRVAKGDARECPADIAIFGRNRNLRAELVREAGAEFVLYGSKRTWIHRGATVLDMSHLNGPWKRAISIPYHPRRFDPFAKAQAEPFSHQWWLTSNIQNLVSALRRTYAPESILFMGLSCRNPEINSMSIVAALMWMLGQESGSSKEYPSLKEVTLIDQIDPDPFVKALRNANERITRAGLGDWTVVDNPADPSGITSTFVLNRRKLVEAQFNRLLQRLRETGLKTLYPIPRGSHVTDDSELHAQLRAMMIEREAELIELHRDIVRLPTVNFGDGSSARENLVAEHLARYLAGAGVKSRVVEGEPERANLLAWTGDAEIAPAGRDRTLLFISHADVVPVGDESDWRFPPFSAEIADGRIWGRGSNDCKMLVAAQAFAVACLARLGLPKRGQVRFAVGADEEAGGRMGFGWLAANEPAFLRCDLGINEGGGAYLGQSLAGERIFLIGTGEKGRFEVRFTARGQGTHASVPWGKVNPLVTLARLADALDSWRPEPRADAPVFERLREWMGLEGALTADNLQQTVDEGARYSRAFFNSLMAQSRVTIVPTAIRAGGKTNVVPARAELLCDARIIPGQTRADLADAVDLIARRFTGVEYEIMTTAEPSVSPFTPELAAIFGRAVDRALGGAGSPTAAGAGADAETGAMATDRSSVAAPTWCTGFTDSRFVRVLGTPMYGLQLVEPNADPDRLNIHCVDESIEVAMLGPCARALGHLALDFLG